MPDREPTEPQLEPSPTQRLTQPITSIKGVVSAQAELLAKLNLHTAADLLFFFPKSYEDFTQLNKISELGKEQLATVIAEVTDIDQSNFGGRQVSYVLVRQDNSFLRAMWFNQSWMLKKFRIGQRVMLQGKSRLQNDRQHMTHPKVTWLDEGEPIEQQQRMLPVYRLTEGINQQKMRKLVAQVVEDYAHLVAEALPENVRKQSGAISITDAIRQVHTPVAQNQIDQARHRLVYQELLTLQLAPVSYTHLTLPTIYSV